METGKIYMTADTHFGDDDSIVRYEGRPFQNGEEMNRSLIAAWNRVVKPEDTVYHLGDFADSISYSETEKIVQCLNGKKILVMGNHDRRFTLLEWLKMGFDEVYPMPVVFQDYFLLSHEPMYVNRAAPYANIFGHVHNNPAYRDVSSRSFCVCVERTGYQPVNFEVIRAAILEEDRKEKSI